MKKIFLIFLMMFCCINVNALECEVKEYGPFIYKDEFLDEYPLIDKNIYEYTMESDLSLTYENKEGRIINSYDGFHYLKRPLLNYVEIEALDNDAYLSDFLFFYDNKPIDYTSNISNKINVGEKIKFKFDENLEVNKFSFTFKALEGEISSYKLNVFLGNDDKVFSNIYMGVSTNSTIKMNASLYPINLSNYDDFYSIQKLDSDDSLKLMGEVKLYTYQDIKYKSYRIVNKCSAFKNNVPKHTENITDNNEQIIYKPVMTNLFTKPKETIKYKTPVKFTMQYKNTKPLQVSKNNIDFINFSLLFLLIFIIIVIIIIKKHINKR